LQLSNCATAGAGPFLEPAFIGKGEPPPLVDSDCHADCNEIVMMPERLWVL